MKSKNESTKKSSAKGTATSRLLRNLEPKEMIDLFQQLYMLSSDNAELIDSQFKSNDSKKLLEEYRQKIVLDFFPLRESQMGFPRMGQLKKLISDYQKGTDDLTGTTELMVTFQEQGMEFTLEYGDINERFYDSLISGMDDLVKMLTRKAPQLFPAFRDRLIEILRRVYGKIGWGYSDGIHETVAEIFEFHGFNIQESGDWKTGYQFKIVGKE
jgi:hypothetical protein